MHDPVFCARCSRTLTPGDGSFYVVTIIAIADPSGPVVDEPPSAEELRKEIENLLAQLRDTSPQEAMDQVHRRLTIHLCLGCYRKWIEDPAGRH
jgi:hypothetical protein